MENICYKKKKEKETVLAGKHLAIWGTKSGFYPSPAEAACSAPGSGRDCLSHCNGKSFPKKCRRTLTKS